MRRAILYFDDEPLLLDTFRELFGDVYDVRTAARLDEAWRALDEYAADIIICDQRMPEIDGSVFLRRAAALYPGAFRILVSGYVQVGDVLTEVGTSIINAFIPKPWTQDYMRQVLERAATLLDSEGRPRPSEGERRVAPRHKVRLDVGVLMMATGDEGGEEKLLPLGGHTQDLSESGLALIVSADDMRALSGLGTGYTLRLMLRLPAGPIELTVTPVRHLRLEGGREYLVGAEITDMSGRDRVRFMEYIRGLSDLDG